jgi:putative intracellular protease/amidase
MTKSILTILSESSKITLQNEKKIDTGFFLNELAVPTIGMRKEGFSIMYASPNGAAPVMDPLSDRSLWFAFHRRDYLNSKRTVEEEYSKGGMNFPIPFSRISDRDLSLYDAVFIPGGHAPMVDLEDNRELGRILKHFHENHKVTGAICHGPIAFLSAKENGFYLIIYPNLKQADWCYSGYKMTTYSNREEWFNEKMWGGKITRKAENLLRDGGAIIRNRLPMLPNVVVDREVITGSLMGFFKHFSAQGPTSAWKFTSIFINSVKNAQ